MNGRRISVRSLCFYMLKKLWVILLVAVAFGFLLAGFKYSRDQKNTGTSTKDDDGSSLTGTERADVENAALQYQYAAELQKYLDESPLRKIDTKNEKQTVVDYRILLKVTGNEMTSGTVENTYLQLLRAYVNDNLFMDDLVKADPAYKDQPYLKELVWCGNAAAGEFTLGVIETEDYPKLSKDVRMVAEAYMDQLMKEDTRLSITPMKEGSISVYDSTTDTSLKNIYSNMVTFRKGYSTAYAGFSAKQQSYFQSLTGFEAETTKKKKSATFSWKYFAVGAAGGVVAGICLCFLLLYLSLKHASAADYSENLGLRNLGLLIVNGKKKHPYRNMLMKKELKSSLFGSSEESVAYAAVRLGAYCRKHEISELAVLCSVNSGVIEEAVELLEKELGKQKVKLLLTEKVGTDADALQSLLDSGKSIFVEQLHGGNRQKASELLQFCKENDVEVIGALGVAEMTL